MLDMQLAFVLLSIAAAMVAFWTMQCITVEAGFSNSRRFSILAMRISLAVLALTILSVAHECAAKRIVVSELSVLALSALLTFLLTLPFAIGGRAGGIALAKRLS